MRVKIKFFVALMYLLVTEFSLVPAIPRYELVYTVIRFVLVSAKFGTWHLAMPFSIHYTVIRFVSTSVKFWHLHRRECKWDTC
jgi:hypothetical protein